MGELVPIRGDDNLALICEHINSLSGPVEILEAGCGRQWPLKLTVPYRLTGIDTDARALASRQQGGDLNRAVVGDLKTADFPPATFDVIYCSYVLEHVSGAAVVLSNFARWLKPGGMIVLRIPDRDSVYGWLAFHTPHWVHVAVKRWVMGNVNAGKPGFDPYPVVYDEVISRSGIRKFCASQGLRLAEERATGEYLVRLPAIAKLGIRTIAALSFGKLAWRHNNLTYEIRRAALHS